MASNADSTLVNRNVTVAGRRTSLRLEPAMWDAWEEVARREGSTVHQICALVDARRRESSLTAAIRVFILGYYRAAATEDGHASIGHGSRAKAAVRNIGRLLKPMTSILRRRPRINESGRLAYVVADSRWSVASVLSLHDRRASGSHTLRGVAWMPG